MDVEMVFNELSLQSSAPDAYIARQWMTTFLLTTVEATKLGVKRVLRIESDFFDTAIAPNYSLNVWLTDKAVNRDEIRRFGSLQTKYPALNDFEGTEIENQYILSDFRYDHKPIHGLGIAYLLDALALSLPSSQEWDVNQILLESPETAIVYHACRSEHVQNNAQWIEHRLKQNIHDGTDLWQRQQELLPHLIFCERVQEQLQSIHSGNPNPAIRVTKQFLENLRKEGVPNKILEGLGLLENQAFTTEEDFLNVVANQIGKEQFAQYKELILKHVATRCFIIGHIGTKLPNVTKW